MPRRNTNSVRITPLVVAPDVRLEPVLGTSRDIGRWRPVVTHPHEESGATDRHAPSAMWIGILSAQRERVDCCLQPVQRTLLPLALSRSRGRVILDAHQRVLDDSPITEG